jgi:hypothetical protein
MCARQSIDKVDVHMMGACVDALPRRMKSTKMRKGDIKLTSPVRTQELQAQPLGVPRLQADHDIQMLQVNLIF